MPFKTKTQTPVGGEKTKTEDDYQPIDPHTTTNFPKSKEDFHWVDTEQIHRIRRREITKKYPEVRELYGTDSITFWIVFLCTVGQIGLFFFLQDKSWPVRLLVGYFLGATMSHTLQMATHELSHYLCWKSITANKLTSIFSDLVTGLPSSITFEKYHSEHHLYLATDLLDPDLPTINEVKFFNSAPLKVLFILLLPIFYALRPMILRPKRPCFWSALNFICVIAFDLAMIYYFGFWVIVYMFWCTLIGLGLHPAAGHLIAEHYEFTEGCETYSYYGALNYINMNVGFHNEHHDFPKIPFRNLPKLREIAPEYYKSMPQYNSYLKVLYTYITDSNVGPFSRIKRKQPEHAKKSQ